MARSRNIYKPRVSAGELKKLTPYIKELASGMKHEDIVKHLDNRVGIATVRKIAKGIVNVNRDRSTETALEANEAVQKRKANFARKLKNKNGLKSKINPDGITLTEINKSIFDRYGTKFSPTTLNKVLDNDEFVPSPRRKLLRSAGETYGQAAWRELTKARKAVEAGTADHAQKILVKKHEVARAQRVQYESERRVHVEGGKASRDFSFLKDMSPEDIDKLARNRGNDAYYQLVQRSKVIDPKTGEFLGSKLPLNDPDALKGIKDLYYTEQKRSFKLQKPLREMDHIISLDSMIKRGDDIPWISGLSVEANLRALEHGKNVSKYNVVTPKDAAKIERQMMNELVKKGLANFKTVGKTVGKTLLKGATSGPLGLIGAGVSLPFLLSQSPQAQAAGEVISAATDPIGYGAFEAGHQLWKRREQRDPYAPKWQRQMKDPTWGGGLLRS